MLFPLTGNTQRFGSVLMRITWAYSIPASVVPQLDWEGFVTELLWLEAKLWPVSSVFGELQLAETGPS